MYRTDYRERISHDLRVSAPVLPVAVASSTDPLAYAASKRLVDVFLAVGVLLALAPLYAFIAALVWLEDRGPIFYSQWRVGKGGRVFRFWKFRSMVVHADRLKAELAQDNEAEGPIFKMRSDPRVTRIGRVLRRYSLDELPQFWNVLRGDMSLVGPRPHLPSEVACYSEAHFLRLSVQPGLVCFREVTGRSNLSFERWMELDLHYIRCRSLGTDLSILCRILPAVLRGEGAY